MLLSMGEFHDLRKELPRVRQNVPLANHTTFLIGGPARYFFIAKTSEDIRQAVEAAKKVGVQYFLLSGGSNVLMSDKGFSGLVIKIQNTKYQISWPDRQNTSVVAESGVLMKTLVRETTQRGLQGFEWAGGLPGTVGGAVRGNAGAFEGETKDCVVEVELLDAKGNKKTFSAKQCAFGYRDSVFKQKGYVVLRVTFQLQRGNAKELWQTVKEHIHYRDTRHPLEYPNAGSVFKNPTLDEVPKKIAKQFAHVIKQDPFPVIPVAAILSDAKLQGMRVGDAEVSEKHPNYIVNKGHAKAIHVLELIQQIKKEIKTKYNVDLEEEVQLVS